MAGSITHYYVDPLNGNNANDGTSDANAYETIQYAIDNLTQNTAHGTAINVKSSALITLSASIDWSSLTLNGDYPIILRGYDSVAGDGGKFEVDVNGYVLINAVHYLIFADCILHNTGADIFGSITLGQYSTTKNIDVSDFSNSISNSVMYSTYVNVTIADCTFTDISGDSCIYLRGQSANVYRCNFYTGTKNTSCCINLNNSSSGYFFTCNTFGVSGTTDGIRFGASNGTHRVINNSFYSTGTGDAITGSKNYASHIRNNIFEGWDYAIGLTNSGGEPGHWCSDNYFYNNSTDIRDITGELTYMVEESNTVGISSAFEKVGTLATPVTYYKPTGDVIAGVDSGLSVGAIQLTSTGGGGGSSGLVDVFGGLLQ